MVGQASACLSGGFACLRGFLNFTGANAGRAYAQTLGGAVDHCVDRLQIQIPAALADVMGVADAVAKLRAAPAYIANSCHITRISSELRNLYSISRVGPSATLDGCSAVLGNAPARLRGAFGARLSNPREINATVNEPTGPTLPSVPACRPARIPSPPWRRRTAGIPAGLFCPPCRCGCGASRSIAAPR